MSHETHKDQHSLQSGALNMLYCVRLSKSTTKIFAYGSHKPLPLKDQFQAALESDKRFTNSVIHVVKGNSGNLRVRKPLKTLD